MRKSQEGRVAAASGDTEAAIANRSDVLKQLQQLRREAEDAKLTAELPTSSPRFASRCARTADAPTRVASE